LKKNKTGKMKSVSHGERPCVSDPAFWSESFFTQKWLIMAIERDKLSISSANPGNTALAAKVH